jgi:uncharacterized protein (TIGR02996 family)
MSADREAFIREVVASGDDDAPRLIYADWLEERGDPQGQFIRLQCELARTLDDPARRLELHQQQCELLAAHRDEWVRSVSPSIRWSTFRRGLLEEVIIDGSAFVKEGGQALRIAPIFELGTCLDTKEEVGALAELAELHQLRKLRLGGSSLGDDGIRRLVQSPHFPAAKVFWLTRCNIGPAGVQALAECQALRGLERLILTGNPLGDVGARILATSPTFANLRLLALDDCEITDEGVQALAHSPTLKHAKGLPIVGTRRYGPDVREESAAENAVLVRSMANLIHRSRELARLQPIPEVPATDSPHEPSNESRRRLTVEEILQTVREDLERRMPE